MCFLTPQGTNSVDFTVNTLLFFWIFTFCDVLYSFLHYVLISILEHFFLLPKEFPLVHLLIQIYWWLILIFIFEGYFHCVWVSRLAIIFWLSVKGIILSFSCCHIFQLKTQWSYGYTIGYNVFFLWLPSRFSLCLCF